MTSEVGDRSLSRLYQSCVAGGVLHQHATGIRILFLQEAAYAHHNRDQGVSTAQKRSLELAARRARRGFLDLVGEGISILTHAEEPIAPTHGTRLCCATVRWPRVGPETPESHKAVRDPGDDGAYSAMWLHRLHQNRVARGERIALEVCRDSYGRRDHAFEFSGGARTPRSG